MKKILCVSAVNLVNGGPLTILQNCLEALSKYALENEIEVYALVHNVNLCYYPNINYIEIAWAKKTWINRLYCEYFYFKKISRKINPDIWVSLHDMTPNVVAKTQIVYCHNATPFYSPKLVDLRYNYKEYLFSLFYKYLYRINIHKNSFVVVQQNWLRNAFSDLFNLNKSRIIVAKPTHSIKGLVSNEQYNQDSRTRIFFYPAFPRTFKNFEVICEASKILNNMGETRFKVVLTLNGSENKYSRDIFQKYSRSKNVEFCGLLPQNRVYEMYKLADCLIFPSKLETWGLPISEFSQCKKPMILADLPYAYETAEGVDDVAFFNPVDPYELAHKMKEVIDSKRTSFATVPLIDVLNPTANSWNGLFDILFSSEI